MSAMSSLDELREIMGDDGQPLSEALKSLAEGLAAFYNTLVAEGVPDIEAGEMTAALITAVCAR